MRTNPLVHCLMKSSSLLFLERKLRIVRIGKQSFGLLWVCFALTKAFLDEVRLKTHLDLRADRFMKSCFHTDIGMAGMDINSLEALLSSSPLQFLEVLSPEDFLSGVFCGTCSVKELLADSIMVLLILKD